MPLVVWSDELCIGVPRVDEEHRKLVTVLNQLDEARRTGKGSRIMSEILAQLIDYAGSHFSSEEQYMSELDYPDLHLHQRQHAQLVEKVCEFQHQFQVGGRRITGKMLEFLKYWLTHHILGDDMAFGRFVTQRNGSGDPVAAASTPGHDGR